MISTVLIMVTESDPAFMQQIFNLQHSEVNLQRLKNCSSQERLKTLNRIEKMLLDKHWQQEICTALKSDLRKPEGESLSNEITPLLMNITYIRKNLRMWMMEEKYYAPLVMLGFRTKVVYEPKGHVMIMSPWNFPFLVTFIPLLYALAAGNAVIIKPSELAPASSSLLEKMINELFEETEVCVVQGGVETAKRLLELPFHHIFFTGSPATGKKVMEAAAKNLASVTLELGGKSPVVIDSSANIRSAAKKIAWAKTLNYGQSCVAPDYVLVQESRKGDFIKEYQKALKNLFGENQTDSRHLGRIIDEKHYHRIKELIDDARQKGGNCIYKNNFDEQSRFIPLTIIDGATTDMRIMQEEIFAPVLPVLTFKEVDEAVRLISRLHRPLVLYIFGSDKKFHRHLLDNTTSGGVVINELMMTIINPALPFGGINHSGIGKSNGIEGFKTFSNMKGVILKRFDSLFLVYPPYRKMFISWLMRLARW
jgi:aldehyde dehydrogenase (NAD+)